VARKYAFNHLKYVFNPFSRQAFLRSFMPPSPLDNTGVGIRIGFSSVKTPPLPVLSLGSCHCRLPLPTSEDGNAALGRWPGASVQPHAAGPTHIPSFPAASIDPNEPQETTTSGWTLLAADQNRVQPGKASLTPRCSHWSSGHSIHEQYASGQL
jgi:hypothetical protein